MASLVPASHALASAHPLQDTQDPLQGLIDVTGRDGNASFSLIMAPETIGLKLVSN
ncbi:protein of unknown function [Cyanobium sp. NIES-981]|nr:protein of unknown function [Cyanobium sp. NIES-981]